MKPILVPLALLALSACGGGSSTPVQSQPTAEEQTEEAAANLTGQQGSDAENEVANIEEEIVAEIEQAQATPEAEQAQTTEIVSEEEAVTFILGDLSFERVALSDEAATWFSSNADLVAPDIAPKEGYEIYRHEDTGMLVFSNNIGSFIVDGSVQSPEALVQPSRTSTTTDYGHFTVLEENSVAITADGIARDRRLQAASLSNSGSFVTFTYVNRGIKFGDLADTGNLFGFARTVSAPTVDHILLNGMAKINDYEDLLLFTGDAEMVISLDTLVGRVSMNNFTADSTQTIAIEAIPTTGTAVATFTVHPETAMLTGYSQFNLTTIEDDIENGIHIGQIATDGKTAMGILSSDTLDGYYAVAAQ